MIRFLVLALTLAQSPTPVPTAPTGPLGLGSIRLPDAVPFIVRFRAAVAEKAPVIRVTIDSPGGDVGLGLGIIALMRDARKQGLAVECTVESGAMAASMAAIIFEAGCSKRIMVEGAALLFHEVRIGDDATGGTAGDLQRMADRLRDINHRVAILTAPWLGMTAGQYEAWLADRDRWLDVEEAQQRGAVDVVVPLR